jgi:tRNA wybutosine-synthesizing protein 3
MDRFAKQKKHALNKLNMSVRMGDTDSEIIPLLNAINSLKDYYTTSSCAGRIQLFNDLGSKRESSFIACWHRKVSPIEVVKEVKAVPGILYFKCEPPILHIAARDTEAAGRLLIAARESGFKHSGIQAIKPERVMVELVSTETIDAPIMEKDGKMVSDGYIKYLSRLANKKYARAQLKIKKLERKIKEMKKVNKN